MQHSGAARGSLQLVQPATIRTSLVAHCSSNSNSNIRAAAAISSGAAAKRGQPAAAATTAADKKETYTVIHCTVTTKKIKK